MSDTPVQDSLYNNLANGRQSPFRDLPHNEMMLMTDRRAQLFLHRVVSALSLGESQMAALDSDLTPLHFWEITQDTKRQGEDFPEYERPWEYSVLPALRNSIIARWDECLARTPTHTTSLTGEQVVEAIHDVVMRRNNVPMEGIRILETVTSGNPQFQTLRDHFAEKVAPYRPIPAYSYIVFGNVWQSMIADCMHRKDREGLKHILSEGKKQSPEALSDAIAFMVMGASGRMALPESFGVEEIAVLNTCMPYMLFSKQNARGAIWEALRNRKIHDLYGMYDMALEQVIKNPELQTDSLSFGYDLGNWTIPEVSGLIDKLVAGGVKPEYIFRRVFFSLIDCRQDVWEKLNSLLPPALPKGDQDLWGTMKTWRKTNVLEELKAGVETDGTDITINMPLGIHHVENAHHTLTEFPLELKGNLDELKTLPDFYYIKPEPTAFATYSDKVPRAKEGAPRTGYKFVALVQAPEKHTWMKLPNHTHHGPGTELGLVALTPDNQSRFFSFDCLEEEFKTHLLANFPVTNH